MKFIALLMFALPLSAQLSLRAGLGIDTTRAATVLDRDCSSTNPPALFGCVDGNDGERLAARGDFGTTGVFELGAAYDVSANARFELMLARRNGLELDADANFPNVTGEQRVSASAKSTAAFVAGTWLWTAATRVAAIDSGNSRCRTPNLVGASPDVRPFVTAGVGVARNEIDAMTFAFPGIASDAVTILHGGSHTGLAYLVGAGLTVPMTNRIDVDFAVRYTDLGQIVTDAGPATIVRPRGTTVITIDGTEADLETIGVSVSMRYRFR